MWSKSCNTSYTLSLDMYATESGSTARLVLGGADEPWPNFFAEAYPAPTELTHFEITQTSSFSIYDKPTQGELSIQLGGQDPTTICMSNISLEVNDVAPEPIKGVPVQACTDDTYACWLATHLQTQYGLEGGTWASPRTEAGVFGTHYTYSNIPGAPITKTVSSIDESYGSLVWDTLPFDDVIQIDSTKGSLIWLQGFGYPVKGTVDPDDKLLFVFWTRTLETEIENNVGYASLNLGLSQPPYSPYFEGGVVMSPEWTMHMIPMSFSDFTFSGSLDVMKEGDANFNIQFAALDQTFEMGGFGVINYGADVDVADLPNTQNGADAIYDGKGLDPIWADDAQARIEEYRKGCTTVFFKDKQAMALANARLEMSMIRHKFKWGTAYNEKSLVTDPIYQEKFLNLDGKGHGFNYAVNENGFKWSAIEEQWDAAMYLEDSIEFLKENDIPMKGHAMMWPAWQYMPDDMEENAMDLDYLQQRVNDHFDTLFRLPNADYPMDWDVLNEPTRKCGSGQCVRG